MILYNIKQISRKGRQNYARLYSISRTRRYRNQWIRIHGEKLYRHDNSWVIAGIEKRFRTSQEAERYIRYVLNKEKQQALTTL